MSFTDKQRRVELLTWARNGIHECFRTTRGANMFGPNTEVKAVDNSTLWIKTDKGSFTMKLEHFD